MPNPPFLSRRSLLRKSAVAASALAAPYFVPARVLGKDGAVAPSNQITLGVMGYGNRCRPDLDHFLTFKEVRCLAAADVKEFQRNACKKRVDQHHANDDCRTYADFREMLARDDIQAMLIVTGNRWHAPASIMAARAGKDVYSEKPICMTIEEGRALVQTCNRLGTVYQAGHQRRSVDSFRFMVDAVQKGMIGKLHTVRWQVWPNTVIKPEAPTPVPPGFDYDMWLGPTPFHPHSPSRVNRWQYFYDTADGMLTDMGCHWADITQWGHNSDHTSPVEFEGQAVFPTDSMSDVCVTAQARAVYADGVAVEMLQQGRFEDRYIRFIGDKGWIQLDDHTNVITAEPRSILKARGAAAAARGGWDNTADHIGNFLRCVRTRQPTICNPETAFRATTLCLLTSICLRLGKKLRWDPVAERFLNDDDANRMLSRPTRAPWHL